MDAKIRNKLLSIKDNISWRRRSRKWKRNNSIVLFGSWFGERYADTSRFLFQFLSDNKERYGLTHVVWVTRSSTIRDEISALGYEVYLMDSMESVRYHQVAGAHFICNMPDNNDGIHDGDIMGKYSYGAKKVNLWHGVMAMKGVAAASNEYKRRKKAKPIMTGMIEFLNKHCKLYRSVCLSGGWGDCYYLSVTPAGTDILNKFFLIPKDHFIETGNPRVCCNVKYTENEKQIISTIKKFNKIILYLPTFRDSDSSFNYNHVASSLHDYLKENQILWVQKAHSATSSATYANKYDGNILSLSSDFDINSIMKDITLLVTDFSSVAADAMYYNKPIIYYMPDYEEYLSKDRGFVIDPETIMMGPKASNIHDLRSYISNYLSCTFEPDNKYRETRLRFWGPAKTMDDIWHDIKKAIQLE